MIDSEVLKKVKKAGSVGELISIASKNGVTLTQEDAEDYFASFRKSGELDDDDLDSVSGGACHMKIDGSEYTVVSSGLKCFTGMYKKADLSKEVGARADWGVFSSPGCCGKCEYLMLNWGIGVCTKSKR